MIEKIALCGIAGSGKDYFGDYLVQQMNFKRIAFADTLKQTVAEIFPFMETDYPPELKELPLNIEVSGNLLTKTPREMWLETSEFLRTYDERYFHNKTMEIIKNINENIIITDLRMNYEFEDLKEQGFTIVHIDNIINDYPLNDFDKQINEFKDKCDYYFTNNMSGTIEFEAFYESIKG